VQPASIASIVPGRGGEDSGIACDRIEILAIEIY
jgi:hypothetical protein